MKKTNLNLLQFLHVYLETWISFQAQKWAIDRIKMLLLLFTMIGKPCQKSVWKSVRGHPVGPMLVYF
uniref:Uncharacterized protein n=1 Tax=Arundo donax TaxID=35708 RepID=A0A0A9EK14_ARUDO